MSLIESRIQKLLSNYIQNAASVIATNYELDFEEVYALLQGLGEDVVALKPKIPSTPLSGTLPNTTPPNTTPLNGTCPYVYSRGVNSGEICGAKGRNEGGWCAIHLKQKDKVQKERKIVPVLPKSSEEIKPSDILKNHPILQRLYNPLTGLVFRSQEDKTVFGCIVDGKISPLTQENINTCKSNGFRYDTAQEENLTTPKVKKTKVVPPSPKKEKVKKETKSLIDQLKNMSLEDSLETIHDKDEPDESLLLAKKHINKSLGITKENDTSSDSE